MSVFDEIDRMVNTDIGWRGAVEKLYKAARKDLPLCEESARLIIDALKGDGRSRYVVITSGFPILPNRKPETDGPLGASILAYALVTLGGIPVFITEDLSSEVLIKTAKSIGVEVPFKKISIDQREPRDISSEIIDEFSPSAIISIERPGADHNGVYHNMNGDDITEFVAPIDHIFNYALEEGIPSIGIGDGGNEIGMGNIRDALINQDDSKERSCIYSSTRTDSLMVAAVSNWGVYGIIAAISEITGDDLLHDEETEEKMLRACVEAGAVDGITRRSELSVDGISLEYHKKIIRRLHCAVAHNG